MTRRHEHDLCAIVGKAAHIHCICRPDAQPRQPALARQGHALTGKQGNEPSYGPKTGRPQSSELSAVHLGTGGRFSEAVAFWLMTLPSCSRLGVWLSRKRGPGWAPSRARSASSESSRRRGVPPSAPQVTRGDASTPGVKLGVARDSRAGAEGALVAWLQPGRGMLGAAPEGRRVLECRICLGLPCMAEEADWAAHRGRGHTVMPRGPAMACSKRTMVAMPWSILSSAYPHGGGMQGRQE